MTSIQGSMQLIAMMTHPRMQLSNPSQECTEQGSYGFLKVMEIDNAIFQGLESFGKEAFKMAMEKF